MRKREGRGRRGEIMRERREKFRGIKKYERECIKKLYLFIPLSYSTSGGARILVQKWQN